MLGKRLLSFFKPSPTSPSISIKPTDDGVNKSWGRKAVSVVLISVTGGVALSALDDLAIYHSCSSKAMEKARSNQAIIDAIGEPIVRGPWYNASLAVAHKRHSLSCTFPVSGPQGTGIFQLKAVRNGDKWWSCFVGASEWDILIMDALLYVPANQGKQQTLRINLSKNLPPPAAAAAASASSSSSVACTECHQPTQQHHSHK